MATPSFDTLIEDIKDDIDILQVQLQSLDEPGVSPGASDVDRIKIVKDIKRLENELEQHEQRRLEQGSASHRPSSSYSLSFDTGSPVPPNRISRGSPGLPQWGSAMFRPASRSIQPNNGFSRPPSQLSHKRHADDADLSDAAEPCSKRWMACSSPSLPCSSRRPSDASDPDDDLWRVLGLDSKDSFREFRDEQKKAEQWLQNRKEEERRDAECARRLQDNLFTPPRPSSAESSSTRYCGSNVFNGLESPARGTEPTGPSRFPELPPISSLKSGADGFSGPPAPPVSAPRYQHRPPISSLPDPDDSDVAEITPAEFQRRYQYPPYHSAMFNRSMRPGPKDLSSGNPYLEFGDFSVPRGTDEFQSFYPPWGPARPAPGSSGPLGSGPGPLYGPNVLQNTMARLDAARESFSTYLRPLPSNDPLASTSFLSDLVDNEFDRPLSYLRYACPPEAPFGLF